MKKFFFLDDSQYRHDALNYQLAKKFDWEIIHVYTSDEAIKMLSENRYDIVSLDHDLSDEAALTEPPRGEKSGYDVACFIAEMDDDKRPQHVIIHSWNSNGATRMAQAMKGKVKTVIELPFRG